MVARRHSSKSLRFAVLGSFLLLATYLLGPAFSVKGSWDGTFSDIKNFPRSLSPKGVEGLAFDQDIGNGHAWLTVENGQVKAHYQEGPASLSMDQGKAWEANFTQDDAKLQMSGSGLNDVNWEAWKRRTVENLGDVEVSLTSKKDVAVSVAPSLPSIFGFRLGGFAHTHGHGLHGRLEARRQLTKNLGMSYHVENAEGDYHPSNLSHSALIEHRNQNGRLVLNLGRDPKSQRYNATYMRNLGKLLGGDAGIMVGAENAGVYGTLLKQHKLGKGIHASYDLSGRSDFARKISQLTQSMRLKHRLGSLKLSHGSNRPVEAIFDSDIGRGSNRFQGRVTYSSRDLEPSFNVSLSNDLASVLNGLDAVGEAQVGVDAASVDGLYGSLMAKRSMGNGVDVHVRSAGRVNDMQHSVKLSNDLGYAELVKAGDANPRLRLGYDLEV